MGRRLHRDIGSGERMCYQGGGENFPVVGDRILLYKHPGPLLPGCGCYVTTDGPVWGGHAAAPFERTEPGSTIDLPPAMQAYLAE